MKAGVFVLWYYTLELDALLDTNYNHVEDRECALVFLMTLLPSTQKCIR
jgi:hypothetical protein